MALFKDRSQSKFFMLEQKLSSKKSDFELLSNNGDNLLLLVVCLDGLVLITVT